METTLNENQIRDFIHKGYVCIEQAFSEQLAAECRQILWHDLPGNPNDPATWTQPVVRLGYYSQKPFQEVANTPRLREAFDQLVGAGRWVPRLDMGTFPVRFSSSSDPGDTGWHIDVSFQLATDDPNDFMAWRANITSQGRALLMLFLFSDITAADAPTRIRVGSHLDIAKRLKPMGEAGLSLRELAANGFQESAHQPEVLATGRAGTVYLCHPFLVHAAQPHRGTTPRFLAQPPLHLREPLQLERTEGDYSPVEQAIRLALL